MNSDGGLWHKDAVRGASGLPQLNMKLKNISLILSIVFLALGLGAMFMGPGESSKMDILQGLFKGLAGVFFIIFYILMLLGKEPMDKTGAEHY